MNSAGQGEYNAEDYQWKDDHLSLDLSRVPTQHPDPPVEATLVELKAAWSKTWNEITQERKWSLRTDQWQDTSASASER